MIQASLSHFDFTPYRLSMITRSDKKSNILSKKNKNRSLILSVSNTFTQTSYRHRGHELKADRFYSNYLLYIMLAVSLPLQVQMKQCKQHST